MIKLCRNVFVGKNSPTFIIAEIGINHCGDIKLALKLIEEAVQCGASCVKFQKRTVSKILTKEGLDAPYINNNSYGDTYGKHKEALELSYEDYVQIKKKCDSLDIPFTASAWDFESVDFLMQFDVPFFKIASADLNNTPLLRYTASKGKPIILSTGMSDMKMVENAMNELCAYNVPIVLMQCTSTYPAPFEDLNLSVIQTYKNKFPNAVIGYSSHGLGIAIPLTSVVLGAKVLEVHFTLDRAMKGSDHAASLEPDGLKKLIRDIRAYEKSLGNGIKTISLSELPCIKKLRKSVVSARPLKKGQIISENDIDIKGPGIGIPPSEFYNLIGKVIGVDVDEDKILTYEMFE